jgi:hypothetical protein
MNDFMRQSLWASCLGIDAPDLPGTPPYTLAGTSSSALVYPSPSLLCLACSIWYGNIDPLSIAYAFRPRLRTRLTLGGLTFPRKPRVYGERVSHAF